MSLLGWPGKHPSPKETVASGMEPSGPNMGMVPWGQSQAGAPFRFLGRSSRGVRQGRHMSSTPVSEYPSVCHPDLSQESDNV